MIIFIIKEAIQDNTDAPTWANYLTVIWSLMRTFYTTIVTCREFG